MQLGKMTAVKLFSRRQELMKKAKARIKEAQKKWKHYYDIKHSKPCVYNVVAKVLCKDFRVRASISDTTYHLRHTAEQYWGFKGGTAPHRSCNLGFQLSHPCALVGT